MHKLSLSDTQTTQEQAATPTQAPLDEPLAVTDNQDSMKSKAFLLLAIVAVVAGIGTGFGSYRLSAKTSGGFNSPKEITKVPGETITAGEIFGSPDESTFKDSAQGYLESGGLDGEGSHKLLRPGGESQTVYLTSSVTDLDKLTGMEVKVWGETFKGQKAGWLMDVGRVEVVDTDAEAPVEQ